jgi:hypothetical protein
MNATPTTAAPMPLAVREYSASWPATAAIAVNTKPANAVDKPKATAPAAGNLAPASAPASIRPISTLAPPDTMTAAVSAA